VLNHVRVTAHIAQAGVGRVRQHQVPFVDGKDARLVLLGNVVGELLVEPGDPLSEVEKKQDHVGAANRSLSPVHRIEIETVADLGAALDARSVNGQERDAVELEVDVDRIAGRSWPLRDDHPLGACQGVDQGRLTSIGPSHHGDLHLGGGRALGSRRGQHLVDHP
jgi:hypothetical protein